MAQPSSTFPTADTAEAQSVRQAAVHPTAILQGQVDLGRSVQVGPFAVLTGPLLIEDGVQIGAHCVIGGQPEHLRLQSSGPLSIGAGTIIREGCVIHHGTTPSGTRIGRQCFIMNRTYVAHDCQIADHVVLSSGVSLGGHVTIQSGANLGLNCSVHQFCTVGAYAMIGMQTPVTKDVPPMALVAGSPMRLMRTNQVALDRLGWDAGQVECDECWIGYDHSNAELVRMLDQFRSRSQRNSLVKIGQLNNLPRKPK
jgi:UDP-N-acetylglucosamine acyltransferase